MRAAYLARRDFRPIMRAVYLALRAPAEHFSHILCHISEPQGVRLQPDESGVPAKVSGLGVHLPYCPCYFRPVTEGRDELPH